MVSSLYLVCGSHTYRSDYFRTVLPTDFVSHCILVQFSKGFYQVLQLYLLFSTCLASLLSQNHRTAQVGRDLESSSCPAFGGKGSLDRVWSPPWEQVTSCCRWLKSCCSQEHSKELRARVSENAVRWRGHKILFSLHIKPNVNPNTSVFCI